MKRTSWLLLFFVLNGPRVVIAAEDIGGVQGGAFQSAIPKQETLKFGNLKTTIQRTPLQIPETYGKLVTIVSGKGTQTLWFESEEGTLRNVIVGADTLWSIQRTGTIAE